MGIFDNDEYVDIYLDSKDANEGTRDNPTWLLTNPITNITGVKVTSALIPFTYYVIDGTNNEFIIEILTDTVATGGTTYVGARYLVHLQPGSYDDSTFPKMLDKVLTYAYNSAEPWDGGVELCSLSNNKGAASSCSSTEAVTDLNLIFDIHSMYEDSTAKIVLYIDSDTYDNNAASFKINFLNCYNPANEIMGFQLSSYNSINDIIYNNQEVALNAGVATNYVKSPSASSLSGSGALYLHSDISSTSQIRNQTDNQNIIAAIIVNANYKGMIEHDVRNQIGGKLTLEMGSLTKISAYLTLGNRTNYDPKADSTSQKSQFLQLQGQSFQICIRFYVKPATIQQHIMSNQGDNFVASIAQNDGSKEPQSRGFLSREVVQARPKGYVSRGKERFNAYPTPAPSRRSSLA
jgi:hypothetical protein